MFEKQKTMLNVQKTRLRASWDEGRVEGEFLATLPNDGQHVSVGATYVCWLIGGLWGAHRLWMGRRFWPTLLYALTGGYFLFGWAWDFITIPAQVKQINKKIDKAIAKHKAEIAKQEAKVARAG